MTLKINIQSRLKRHSRNLLHTRKGFLKSLSPVKLFFLLAILLPFYPSIGSTGVQGAAPLAELDYKSIVSAYYDTNEVDPSLFANDSGFVRPGSIISSERDISGTNELVMYNVRSGDSLSIIANKFQVSSDSILWANDFDRDHVLKPGDVIKVPPTTGLVYVVQPKDTVDSVASKFKVDSVDILAQNQLDASTDLQIGQQLIIPGAKKEIPKPVIVQPKDNKALVKTDKNGKKKNVLAQNTTKKTPKNVLAIYKRDGKNSFAPGYCTWFVANHKNVTWRGNANQWLANARAAGVSTGSSPVAGSIVQFGGRGYNRAYGHVGLVVDVDGDDLIVKDMNYSNRYQVTIRRVPKDDDSIRGYIYAD